jgi:propanol-preferring alcohol dehydrogenase
MKAMLLDRVVSMKETTQPLRWGEVPEPVAGDREVLLRVSVCGVCHTELDEIEGRLKPPRLPIVPGHQVIGRVEQIGRDVTKHAVGDRLGVGWIHHSSGTSDENLSPQFRATGYDVNGGYAPYMTVPEDYGIAVPDALSDVQAAPLLCAGAVGYRALRLAAISDGQPLGLMGFGGSAHLVLQMTKHLYPHSKVYVFDRKQEVGQFARQLGADWSGAIDQRPSEPLAAIIDTTPAWRPVVESMKSLAPGGRLVINAIRKEEEASDKRSLLELSYHDHLWLEREIKTVANVTHFDIAEFLPLAASIPLRPSVTTYPLSQANEALQQLHQGGIKGANVLIVDA